MVDVQLEELFFFDYGIRRRVCLLATEKVDVSQLFHKVCLLLHLFSGENILQLEMKRTQASNVRDVDVEHVFQCELHRGVVIVLHRVVLQNIVQDAPNGLEHAL